jgi:hypothetical protein
MNSDIAARGAVDESTAVAFAAHLEQFAAQLTGRETTILRALLYDAMGPWERLAARPVHEILRPEEADLTEQLVEQARRGA